MQNLLKELILLLSEDERLVSEGKLLKNKVIEIALNMDAGLIKLLLKNEGIKRHFFAEIGGVLVFDKIKFQRFVSNKQFLPDSYTAFKNKIGLVNENGDYLSESREVVLAWPYKDCVLEGGQTKEDQKRDEIFWNETLAPDEIDRLLAPKLFTNFKRYDKDGEHKLTGKEKTDFTKENLIIKGNNLLALHSLYKRFTGKVNLIYIDPPYNTGKDSFGYNDNFNHSSWLTFMKNRLDVAYNFLSAEGLIFVHCDKNEAFHLKILLDKIFRQENHIDTITTVNNPRGRDYGGIANMHEYVHVYAKDKDYYIIYDLERPNKEFDYKDRYGGFDIRELRNRNTRFNESNRPNLVYPFYVNPKSENDDGFYDISLEPKKGWIEVYPAKSQGIQTVWRWGKELSSQELNKNICARQMEDGRYQIVEKYRKSTRMARSVWWDKEVNSELGTKHLRKMFGKKVFDYPKPETLIKRIIEMATEKGNLVMDFCLGSGTTASTCHKIGRRYIGIEQMNYVEDIIVKRLRKVIDGEDGGISQIVNWQGGGSFIYCELMEYNEAYINRIRKAKTTKELLAIWNEMQEKAFISYKIDPKTINANISEFESLGLDDQKHFLIEVLDKNQLYVNYSELDDEDYGVTDTDKKLNRNFYGEA